MERETAKMHRDMGAKLVVSQKIMDAQELIYAAWEADERAKKIALARKALKVSADCADAWVLLAEQEAQNLDEALGYYSKGVAAGERALGPELFKQKEIEFWLLLESRPYMRAKAGLMDCLWWTGREEASLEAGWEMLELNPNDNQGIRHQMLSRLIALNRIEEAWKLYKKYPHDAFATWAWLGALLSFCRNGKSSASKRAFNKAMRVNDSVPVYLLGHRSLPTVIPNGFRPGSEGEAVVCVDEIQDAWEATRGSFEWLKTVCNEVGYFSDESNAATLAVAELPENHPLRDAELLEIIENVWPTEYPLTLTWNDNGQVVEATVLPVDPNSSPLEPKLRVTLLATGEVRSIDQAQILDINLEELLMEFAAEIGEKALRLTNSLDALASRRMLGSLSQDEYAVTNELCTFTFLAFGQASLAPMLKPAMVTPMFTHLMLLTASWLVDESASEQVRENIALYVNEFHARYEAYIKDMSVAESRGLSEQRETELEYFPYLIERLREETRLGRIPATEIRRLLERNLARLPLREIIEDLTTISER
ncbi:hypothetical protein KQI52_11690 [bacterium]|nr:hypothetical protein [bacterium]